MVVASPELNYSAFGFERSFDRDEFVRWVEEKWTLSFWYSGLYVVGILASQRYMRTRPRFEIRPWLVLWSAFLAVFSVVGALRMMPETYLALRHYGFEYSVCNPSFAHHTVTAFWTFMFAMSKVYELGDTIFIVLRKQKLIFLHIYHHVTVFIYTWYSVQEQTAAGRWFVTMNYMVHSFMYTYYTLRALRIHVPRGLTMAITAMQISQMVMGIIVNVKAYRVKARGDFCQQTYSNIQWAFIMYFTYFILFIHFFYKAYFAPKPAKVEKAVNGHTKYIHDENMNGFVKKMQ